MFFMFFMVKKCFMVKKFFMVKDIFCVAVYSVSVVLD